MATVINWLLSYLIKVKNVKQTQKMLSDAFSSDFTPWSELEAPQITDA